MDIRLSIDWMICHGHACLKGTRIQGHPILRRLACGVSLAGILQGFRTLNLEDILACFGYGEALAEEKVTPLYLL